MAIELNDKGEEDMIGNGKSLTQTIRESYDGVVNALTELVENPRRLLMILGTGVTLGVGTLFWITAMYPLAFVFLVAGLVLAMQTVG